LDVGNRLARLDVVRDGGDRRLEVDQRAVVVAETVAVVASRPKGVRILRIDRDGALHRLLGTIES
jgi:hypothetical protein